MTQGGDAGLFFLENVLKKRVKMHGGAGGGVGGNMGGGEKDPWEVNKIKVLNRIITNMYWLSVYNDKNVCKQLNYNATSTQL